MSKCIDINDAIYQARTSIGTSPISKANGELNVFAIDNFKAQFLEGIVEDGLFDPVEIQVAQWGDEFFQSMTSMNNFLQNTQLDQHPELADRISKGPISAIEYADFIGAYNYSPPRIKTSSTLSDKGLLKNLNSYYRDSNSSILGGFCSMMPQVFGAVAGFFTILGSVSGLINDALAFLNKLRNLEDPIQAIIEKITVTSLINAIKEKMTQVITETWESVVAAVNNFNLEEIVGEVETFINDKVFAKAAQIRDDISAILTDENKEGLVDKAKALFDYAVSLFSNPSLQEIQFLIARFCSFVANVEALIKDIKTPMDNYAFKYQRIVGRLQRVSGMATAAAVAAGATRYDSETRQAEINRMREQWSAPSDSSSHTQVDNPQDEVRSREVNRPEQLPDTFSGCSVEENPTTRSITGRTPGDHHPTPTGHAPNNPHPPSAGEYGDIPTWDEIKDGNHPRISFTSGMGERGWTGINPEVKAKLMRLQGLTGAKLQINSGFRSEQYQAALRERYRRQGKSRGRFNQERQQWDYGVAFHSQHMQGNAVDVAWGNWSRSKFINDARLCGFKFIKRYNTFVHIDIVQR